MIDVLKSLLSPKELVIILVSLMVSGWFGTQNYSLRKERRNLKESLARRDSIIMIERSIIKQADIKIDSIQIKRNENDTATYTISADSLERLWTNEFGD